MVLMRVGIRRNAAARYPRWKYTFTRKRAFSSKLYAKSIWRWVISFVFCSGVSICEMIPSADSGVMIGSFSNGMSTPSIRNVGFRPTAR
jgi:hypothetical protein